jgi:hypothetical protein
VRRDALGVGMGEAVRDDVEPSVELVLVASAYLNSGRSDWLYLATQGAAEHVLE